MSLLKIKPIRGKTTEDLHGLKARHRTLVDAAEEVVSSLDRNGRFTAINQSGLRRFGLTEEEVIGKRLGDLWPADKAAHHKAQLARVLETGRPVRFEHHTGGESGGSWFACSLSPICGATGQVAGVSGIERDITRRVLAESQRDANLEEVREARDYLENLITYANAPIITWNPELRITRFNRAFERLIGRAAAGVLGERIDLLFPDDRREESMAHIRRTMVGERWETVQIPVLHRDGSERTVLWNSATLYAADGATPVAAIAQGADITGRVRAEEELRRLNEELEQRVAGRTAELRARVAQVEALNGTMANLVEDLQEANRRVAETAAQLQETNAELEAFSYSVSHDLRAPLRHIHGYVQMLRRREKDRLDPTSYDHLEVISQAAGRMGQLIADLLAFSRIGREEMKLQRVEPSELVQIARRELAPVLEGRQISWEIGPLPAVQADPALLQLVWVNLLSNAIKYSAPRARARIEIGATRSEDEEGELIFLVRDNGVGYDPRYGDRLFGVFQRLHTEEEFEGTGIGLAQVRRIIHRHGGRVWAEGEVDGGAAFCFTLREAV